MAQSLLASPLSRVVSSSNESAASSVGYASITNAIPTGPPPKGAGVGPTPPSTVEAASQKAQASPEEFPYPPKPEPVHPNVVKHTMECLACRFYLNVDEYAHVEWPMLTGLIRDIDARGICDALGIPHRERVLSPDVWNLQ